MVLDKSEIKFNMKKFYGLDNQQETSLQKLESSETIRETTFNKDFLYWFIGFFEGDGSLIVMKESRVFLIITQNELHVLYKIKHFFSRGRVQKHGKCFRYIVTKKKDVSFFFNDVFIGFYTMRCLNKFSTFLNGKFNLLTTGFLNNAWLSGFIDAEGCFYIRLVKRRNYKIGYQIRTIFILDQKLINENVFMLFSNLNKVLPGRIDHRNNKNYRLIIEHKESLMKLRTYLSRYPLKTHKKSIQYKHWLRAFRIKEKKEKTFKDIQKIMKIKSWRYSPPLYESTKI